MWMIVYSIQGNGEVHTTAISLLLQLGHDDIMVLPLTSTVVMIRVI